MPYTLAHAAAAVPLKRALGRRASLSALAIGSMLPDTPYFVYAAGGPKDATHHPLALLWFCLPVGVSLWWLFDRFLRAPLAALLPDALQRRLPAPSRGLGVVAVSVLAGGASHLAWDSFTQVGSPLFAVLPFLELRLFDVGGDPLRLHRVLQHLSTLVGIGLLAHWTWRWARPALPEALADRVRRRAWIALAAAPALWALAASYARIGVPDTSLEVRRSVVLVAVELVRALAVGIIAWAAVWHLRRRAANRVMA